MTKNKPFIVKGLKDMPYVVEMAFDDGDRQVAGINLADLIENCIHTCVDTDLEDFITPDSIIILKQRD